MLTIRVVKCIIMIAFTLLLKMGLPGAGKMAQSVKCLPSKHKDLSLDLQHPHKKLSMAAGRWRRGTLGAHWPFALAKWMCSWFSERLPKRWGAVEDKDINFWPLHVCTHVLVYQHVHMHTTHTYIHTRVKECGYL